MYIPHVRVYEMTGDTSTVGSLPKDKLGGLKLAPMKEHPNPLQVHARPIISSKKIRKKLNHC